MEKITENKHRYGEGRKGVKRKRSAEREREEARQPGTEVGSFFLVDVLVSVLKWVIERD